MFLGLDSAKMYHDNVEIGKAYLNSTLVFYNNYHTITQNLVNYATTNSLTLPTNMVALDTFIRATSTVLAKLDVFYSFVDNGSTGLKLVNIINPGTYNATGFGGLVWSNSGVTGNGTNAYISTNFNPSLVPAGQKYQLNAASRGALVYTNPAATALESTIDGGGSLSNTLFAFDSNGNKINQGATNASANSNLAGTGLKTIVRTAASNVITYEKSTATTTTAASTILGNVTQVILARDNAGVLAYSKLTLSNYFMGGILDATDISTLRTAMNTYLTTLGLTAVA